MGFHFVVLFPGFFDRIQKISYAKSKSDTIAKLDGTYRMPNIKSAETTTTTGSFVPLPGQETKKEETADTDKMDTTDATSASAKDVAGQKRRREDESGKCFSPPFFSFSNSMLYKYKEMC